MCTPAINLHIKENKIPLPPVIQCWLGEHLFNAYLISIEKGIAKVNPICNITGPYAPSPSFVFVTDEEESILKKMLT